MKRSGFTLLEMAITLILVGLVAGIGLKLTQQTNSSECYTKTKAQIATIKEAIERFAIKNDRFPMPSRRNVGVESPSYGREVDPTLNVAAINLQLDTVANATYGTVAVFGALPFQALGIPVENAMDCWGNKFTYVVTKELTEPKDASGQNKFLSNTNGAMDINTTLGATTPFLAGAGFAIISHGQDELGAVKNNYNTTTNTLADRKWCTNDNKMHTQNCALLTSLVSAEFNDGKDAAANYYDDLIVYRGKPWRDKQRCPLCWFIPFAASTQ